MPNIKSQEKRVLTNKKNTLRNKAVKSNLRTVIKKAEASLASGSEDKAAVVNAAQHSIDEACKKGVIHKNTASRKKAAIAKKANA